MKITELLNAQPTDRSVSNGEETVAPPMRKLDMASLDLYASQRKVQEDTRLSIVPPPPHDTKVVQTAPTISPIVSGGSSNDDERDRVVTTRKRRSAAKPRKGRDAATNALVALAQAAADAVKKEEEEETTKRPTRPVKIKTNGTGSSTRSAPMTDDEKRAKQRMLVKKSYYRKIDTLNTLRETVSELEKEYNAVVLAAQQNQPKTTLPRHSISALVGASSVEGELMQSFQEMAVTIDRLRHENEGLRAVAMEQSKARTRVGILVHEEFEEQQKRVTQYGEILQQIPSRLRTPEEEAEVERALSSPKILSTKHAPSPERPKRNGSSIIQMTPMTEDECIDVARDAYAELMQFRKSKDYITSGGHVFGWRDRRRIVGNQVQFALEKTFLHHTAEQLATKMWRVLSTEHGVNRIYSSSLRATYHLVQRVSEHNIVFYRTMERVDQNVLIKTLILASFVQIEDGYMVLFRSIDPHKRNVRDTTSPSVPPMFSLEGVVPPPQRKEMWIDMFSWGVIEPCGPNNEHCTDFFGGFVPATVTANGAFWLMEVLLIAVRCESECVGPLFILDQSSDDEKPTQEATKQKHTWLDNTSPDEAEDVVMEMP